MPSMFAEKKINQASIAVANQTTAQGKRMPAVPALQKKAAGLEDEALQGKFNPIQKMGPHEEEEPLQGKFNPVQKVEEEELPVQGKFDPIQKVEEEELPVQGKFDPIQKVEEEELPVQGKFNPIQKVEEEELPVQGKFNPIQKVEKEEPLQGKFNPIQKKENKTGLPDNLKSGVENLSGMDISDVKVHYNSSQPAQLNALAYAQGTDIHVAPGQEKHLPHEAWHVVQQKQGRVQATKQMKEGVPVNDDRGLETEADVMGAKAVQMKYNESVVSSRNGSNIAQLTKGTDNKTIGTLVALNAATGLALTVADFGVAGAIQAHVDAAILSNPIKLYNGIDQGTLIATYQADITANAAVPVVPITYAYDPHGDKHFPGGAEGTKFTKAKTKVNPTILGLVTAVGDRVKADANGANQTYYYTLGRIATICPARHDVTVQIDYTHADNKITYHAYPDDGITVFALSKTKGGAAIPQV